MPANPYQWKKPMNILNVVNASCYVHTLVTIGEFIQEYNSITVMNVKKAFSQRHYLVQHQIHSMQKAYECNQCVGAGGGGGGRDSVIFQSSFNIKEPIPWRSHLSIGVQVFFITRIPAPDQNMICKWKHLLPYFRLYSTSKCWRENCWLYMKSLLYSPSLFHYRRI